MKKKFPDLKLIPKENMQDLAYLLFVGVPIAILLILINPYLDYTHLY